ATIIQVKATDEIVPRHLADDRANDGPGSALMVFRSTAAASIPRGPAPCASATRARDASTTALAQ
ncbi:MAG: hypothetical protein ACHREM_21555, partial [Polyangiales bacterium]